MENDYIGIFTSGLIRQVVSRRSGFIRQGPLYLNNVTQQTNIFLKNIKHHNFVLNDLIESYSLLLFWIILKFLHE